MSTKVTINVCLKTSGVMPMKYKITQQIKIDNTNVTIICKYDLSH